MVFVFYLMVKNDGVMDGVFVFILFLNSKIWGDLVKDKLLDFLKEEVGWKVFGIYVVCFIFNFVLIISLLVIVVLIVLFIYFIYVILDRYGMNFILFMIIYVIIFLVFLLIYLFII